MPINKQNALAQLADLFRSLALASPEERASLKRGITDADWTDMESMANFAGMFAGIESDITLDRGKLGELVRSMLALQDRALETVFVNMSDAA